MNYYELNTADLDRWITRTPEDEYDEDDGYMCPWCQAVHYEPCDLSHEAQAQINELHMTADSYDDSQCSGAGCLDGCIDCIESPPVCPWCGQPSHVAMCTPLRAVMQGGE